MNDNEDRIRRLTSVNTYHYRSALEAFGRCNTEHCKFFHFKPAMTVCFLSPAHLSLISCTTFKPLHPFNLMANGNINAFCSSLAFQSAAEHSRSSQSETQWGLSLFHPPGTIMNKVSELRDMII